MERSPEDFYSSDESAEAYPEVDSLIEQAEEPPEQANVVELDDYREKEESPETTQHNEVGVPDFGGGPVEETESKDPGVFDDLSKDQLQDGIVHLEDSLEQNDPYREEISAIDSPPEIRARLAETETQEETPATDGIEVTEETAEDVVLETPQETPVQEAQMTEEQQRQFDKARETYSDTEKFLKAKAEADAKQKAEAENKAIEEGIAQERDAFLEEKSGVQPEAEVAESVEPVSLDEKIALAKQESEAQAKALEEAEAAFQKPETTETEAVQEQQDVGDIVPKDERAPLSDEELAENPLSAPVATTSESFEQNLSKEEQLAEEFGISIERLEKTEFGNLTEGQKTMVIENLQQAKLGMIQDSAEAQHKEYIADAEAKSLANKFENKYVKTAVGLPGKVWRSLRKGWKISTLEKTSKEQIDKGGMDTYGEVLGNLVEAAKKGPEVEYENGERILKFNPGFENLEPQQAQKVERFNEVANTYSKIPQEWGYEGASKREQKQFEAAKKDYEAARLAVAGLNLDQLDGKQKTATFLAETHAQIEIGRYLKAHPNAQKEIEKIDSPTLWRGFEKFAKEKGPDAVKYGVTRAGVAFSLGLSGSGLLVLAGLAATGGKVGERLAKKQAEQTLQLRDKDARKGVEDTSDEARNFIDAKSQVEKLENLLKRYEETDDPIKQQRILHSMDARLNYIDGKDDEGRIKIGKDAEGVYNKVKLEEARGLVQSTHAIETMDQDKSRMIEKREEKLNRRLSKQLGATEEEIETARKMFTDASMKQGFKMGLGFALAGSAIQTAVAGTEEAVVESTQESTQSEAQKETSQDFSEAMVAGEAGARSAIEAAPKMPSTHTVEAGDNLWNIVKDDLEQNGKLAGLDEAARNKAIDDIHDRFKYMTSEELKGIGIESGNPHQLEIGDKINLGAVYEDLDSEFVRNDEILAAHDIEAGYGVEPVETLPEEELVAGETKQTLETAPEAIAQTTTEEVIEAPRTPEQIQLEKDILLLKEDIRLLEAGFSYNSEFKAEWNIDKQRPAAYLFDLDKHRDFSLSNAANGEPVITKDGKILNAELIRERNSLGSYAKSFASKNIEPYANETTGDYFDRGYKLTLEEKKAELARLEEDLAGHGIETAATPEQSNHGIQEMVEKTTKKVGVPEEPVVQETVTTPEVTESIPGVPERVTTLARQMGIPEGTPLKVAYSGETAVSINGRAIPSAFLTPAEEQVINSVDGTNIRFETYDKNGPALQNEAPPVTPQPRIPQEEIITASNTSFERPPTAAEQASLNEKVESIYKDEVRQKRTFVGREAGKWARGIAPEKHTLLGKLMSRGDFSRGVRDLADGMIQNTEVDGMSQWEQVKNVEVEELREFNKEQRPDDYAHEGKNVEKFVNKNERELYSYVKALKRSGFEPEPGETVQRYLLRAEQTGVANQVWRA